MEPMVLSQAEFEALDEAALEALAQDGVEVRVLRQGVATAGEPPEAAPQAAENSEALHLLVKQQAEILATLKRIEAELPKTVASLAAQLGGTGTTAGLAGTPAPLTAPHAQPARYPLVLGQGVIVTDIDPRSASFVRWERSRVRNRPQKKT